MIYEPMGGETIDETARKMVALAEKNQTTVTASFNDVPLTVAPGDSPEKLASSYSDESQRRHAAYLASPEYAKAKRDTEERDRIRAALLAGALAVSPASPTWNDPEKWKSWAEQNSDPYGAAVVRYAQLWARLMEGRLQRGDTVEGCAEDASHIADTEGITGFMYGCAVSMLAECWIHGEELRRWHNLKTQVSDEGERANTTGGVLNPALLTIGK